MAEESAEKNVAVAETSFKVESSHKAPELTKDFLDEAFDNIILAEEQNRSVGFKAGQRANQLKHTVEGFALGARQGFELGSEVGIYMGFANTWIQVLKAKGPASELSVKHQRALKVLEKIIETDVPIENPKVDP